MLSIFNNPAFGLLLLRLTLGGLMIFHGFAKVGNPGSLDFIGGKLLEFGLPGFIAYGVFLGEVLGPVLIIFGVFSRLGALLVAGNMVFALILVHSDQFANFTKSGGWELELQGFFLMTALVLLFTGSGRYAIKPD
ncbi:DoxX family protein [Kiloniella laminariae]|uniref:DoxX family protein n=1 Tax=Kiloniella laminariae TaxID=454162 RepID=UPI0003A1F4FB|nr:DoxX family protein [Kiloniella laminariae]